jgi:hypothetical protein
MAMASGLDIQSWLSVWMIDGLAWIKHREAKQLAMAETNSFQPGEVLKAFTGARWFIPSPRMAEDS